MKFSTLAVLAAFVMVAAAQDDGVISINPITSTPEATESASASASPTVSSSATVVPVPTNVPTVAPPVSPSSSSVVPAPSPSKPASSGNALNIPVKAMVAIGGGAALLAQLF
ncbi:hypothetical protein BGZ75_000783 [Mortierella antarctica]|uniref:Uncharacterized protein n=1 Tax=Mortierella alpina TaxID=64518 RepID=A0A9P8CZF1_MORAP|nr:hypothetical protein BGZ67_004333 [Mortierella alpina]KAF9990586.1 hypothetical protein BGZ75_000783 [Mortierella antarctica]KAG9324534.1 hypothetical protein KVV02_006028 [Mortierella alpina]